MVRRENTSKNKHANKHETKYLKKEISTRNNKKHDLKVRDEIINKENHMIASAITTDKIIKDKREHQRNYKTINHKKNLQTPRPPHLARNHHNDRYKRQFEYE